MSIDELLTFESSDLAHVFDMLLEVFLGYMFLYTENIHTHTMIHPIIYMRLKRSR